MTPSLVPSKRRRASSTRPQTWCQRTCPAQQLALAWRLAVISGVVTLAVLAGVAYYFITKSDGGDDETIDVTPTKGGAKKDMDDPLAEARKIMDKYK
ncbi:hypothetical protein HYH03_010814 [Edaphochlamys debaryana]|uniref:Uncharacterized protein n=1 Tax=Edaphochlamys debaryana TaxID=47281 RepID=A0A836BVQ4_9CHLO|nr:hypothetical protein HYH03_010814 [Edaphochlamys debaryana]|eukprot:KAG2490901.1 hypothetical protein HYH03_010814 [Edaphochlamys debaryana]